MNTIEQVPNSPCDIFFSPTEISISVHGDNQRESDEENEGYPFVDLPMMIGRLG